MAQFPDGAVSDVLLELCGRDVEGEGAGKTAWVVAVTRLAVHLIQCLFHRKEDVQRSVRAAGERGRERGREGERKKEGERKRERERGGGGGRGERGGGEERERER